MANDITTADAPVVEIAAGKLRGASSSGVCSFKGMPYGASTAGRNRFMPARPPQPWVGVREALAYGGRAWQLPNRPKRRALLETVLGPADTAAEGEDCLTLNLWTPGLGDGARRPVMVWLHGGAFAYGSGNRAVTDGANLARRGDVVVVSVNHRLNIFGFLHLADIGGSAWAHSGNAGVLDIVAALRWVRDNIAALWRRPRQCHDLRRVGRRREGQRAAGDAGRHAGCFTGRSSRAARRSACRPRERANALAEAVLTRAGGLRASECERLQTLPAERFSAAIAPASRAVGRSRWPLLDRYDFGPVVDGSRPAAAPGRARGAGDIADDIPLMVGGTREESAFFLADDDAVWNGSLSEAELRQRVAAVAGAETDALLAAYRRAMPEATRADRLIAALTGSNFWIRTILLAERYAARRRAPVYMYSLDWQSPAHGGRLKAHHAMDLPFVFDNVDVAETTAGAPGAHELAERISATWIAFARNGRPDNPAIPSWPAYSSQERATMIFDTECRIAHDPDREARLLWSHVVAHHD